MQGMTKRELQITDLQQIRAILDTAKVLRLGLAVNNEPYVVPMNYGYTMEEGRLTVTDESGFAFDVICNLTARQRAILLAGGLLNYTKEGGL